MKTKLTLKQVAEILQVSEFRAQELVRMGVLPVIRLGRQYRVDPDQLEEFFRNGGRGLAGGWAHEGAAVRDRFPHAAVKPVGP
jgi:putative molybdopterin biosynthesis protein